MSIMPFGGGIEKIIILGQSITLEQPIERVMYDGVEVFHKEYKPERLYATQYFSNHQFEFHVPYADSEHTCKCDGTPLMIFYNNTDETYNYIHLVQYSPTDPDDIYHEPIACGHVRDLNVCPFTMPAGNENYFGSIANCFMTDSRAMGGRKTANDWRLGKKQSGGLVYPYTELKPGEMLYVTNYYYTGYGYYFYGDESYLFKA